MDDSETSSISSSVNLRSHNQTQRGRPRSPAPPKYKQLEERLNSFIGVPWPDNMEATPDKLAKAGFFFYSMPDRVKCAFCYGRLCGWQPKDSAIEEHIRILPDCSFAQNIKEQTTVLSQNIRSEGKSANSMSSEELIRECAEQRGKSSPSKSKMKQVYSRLPLYECRIIRYHCFYNTRLPFLPD